MKKRFLLLLIAAALFLCSCDGKLNLPHMEQSKNPYPIESDVVLTYFMPRPNAITAKVLSMNDTPFKQELEKQTGIKVNFIHAPTNMEEQFVSLMIASNDLTDIVEYSWSYFIGENSRNAGADMVVASLDEEMERYSPSFHAYLNHNPDVKKSLAADDGSIYVYPFIRQDEVLKTYRGCMVRADVMENLGLAFPETIEEWDRTLRELKDAGFDTPIFYTLNSESMETMNLFVGAFGIGGDFYLDGNVVKYGPYEEPFGEFVRMMALWYKDGLLGDDISGLNASSLNDFMLQGRSAIAYGTVGGTFGMLLPLMNEKGSGFRLAPLKYPAVKKGMTPEFGHRENKLGGYGAMISANSMNKALAMRLLDYAYSAEGHKLYNFGIEGVSYTMQEGKPVYTDDILEAERLHGMTIQQAMAQYLRAYTPGPFVQDKQYLMQYYTMPEQKQALEVWSDTNMSAHSYPSVMCDESDAKEFNEIMGDVKKYQYEMVYKLITGEETMENLAEYFDMLKKLRIEDAIQIKQRVYDEYTKNNERR